MARKMINWMSLLWNESVPVCRSCLPCGALKRCLRCSAVADGKRSERRAGSSTTSLVLRRLIQSSFARRQRAPCGVPLEVCAWAHVVKTALTRLLSSLVVSPAPGMALIISRFEVANGNYRERKRFISPRVYVISCSIKEQINWMISKIARVYSRGRRSRLIG